MDNQAVETALKTIEEQIAAIRSAMGGEGKAEEMENPMITPEKPSMMGGLQLGK
jgi:hypothetical protein